MPSRTPYTASPKSSVHTASGEASLCALHAHNKTPRKAARCVSTSPGVNEMLLLRGGQTRGYFASQATFLLMLMTQPLQSGSIFRASSTS